MLLNIVMQFKTMVIKMTYENIIKYALEEGFLKAHIVDTSSIVFDPAFRPYCKENLCGQYGINYSCPPDCDTPEAMKQRVLSHKKALVLQTVCRVNDLTDTETFKHHKKIHNAATIRLVNRLRAQGINGFIVGSSGCNLCEKCAITENKPCLYPDLAFSCMSAYCIYVKKLAETCGMEYDYKDNNLYFFGMYVFD